MKSHVANLNFCDQNSCPEMKTLAVVFLLLLFKSPLFSALPSFQISIPYNTIYALILSEIPVAEALIKSAPIPPYCCYDDVDASGVHLNFQNLLITDPTASGTSSISSSGLNLSGTVGFTFDFSYVL